MPAKFQLRLRRGASTDWAVNPPVLAAGEPAWESDTNTFKIGDGTHSFVDLPGFPSKSYVDSSRLSAQAYADTGDASTLASAKAYTDTGVAARLRYGGAWSNVNAYSVNDVVVYNGTSYVCTKAVSAAAATTAIGSGTYSSDTLATNRLPLPAGCAAGDTAIWMITTATTNQVAAPINTPAGASAVYSSSAATVSSNELNVAVFTYPLSAADVANGYLAIPSPAGAGAQVKLTSVAWIFRNLLNTKVGTARATTLTPPALTTAVPSIIFYLIAESLQGGSANVETMAGATAIAYANGINPSNLSNNHVTAIAYEAQAAAGTSTARAFAGTMGQGSAGTQSWQYAIQLNAGANTTPDLDPTDWTALSPTPPGTISMFGGPNAPAGYLLCNGASYNSTDYPGLYAAIGTIFGTTAVGSFSVPDLRNRFAMGNDPGAPSMAAIGGSTTHQHTLTAAYAYVTGAGTAWNILRKTVANWTSNIQSTLTPATSTTVEATATALGGATDTADTRPPFLTVNYIIKI